MRFRILLPIVATMALALTSCSRERQDWQAAQAADTPEAYTDFVKKHPEGELATQAQTRLSQLVDERDWQVAAATDTPEGYQQFIQLHPGSKWVEEARIRLESFSIGAQPAARATPAPAAPMDTEVIEPQPDPDSVVVTEPVAQPAQKAPAAKVSVTPRSSAFGIQLGAFSSEQNAKSQWAQLERAHPELLGGLSSSITSVKGPSGPLWRLRASTASEAKSRSLCQALKARNVPCVVVLPTGVAN